MNTYLGDKDKRLLLEGLKRLDLKNPIVNGLYKLLIKSKYIQIKD